MMLLTLPVAAKKNIEQVTFERTGITVDSGIFDRYFEFFARFRYV